jgi:hypothetical protein
MGERKRVYGYNIAIIAMVAIAEVLAGCHGGSATTQQSRPSGGHFAGADLSGPRHQVPGYGNLPIRFEPNIGQAPEEMQYVARGIGYVVAVTDHGPLLSFRESAPTQRRADAATLTNTPPSPPLAQAWLRLSLVHARTTAHPRAEQRQTSVSNYFIGNDPSQWRSNVANYAAVRYKRVYPGIDWLVYGNPQKLEYDFVVFPQADPRQIKLKMEGAGPLSLGRNGDLLVKVHGEVVRQLKPVIYQTAADGARRNVGGHYVLHSEYVTFALDNYDHSRQLIIDPILVYSTYLGGSGGDSAAAIAVDNAGNTYIAGSTNSTDFPTANPLQGINHDQHWGNAFVAKFNATGTALVYSTYLGGGGNAGFQGDAATAIAIDASGSAYVTGYTSSTNFPTVEPLQPTNNAAANESTNVFVTKLNAAGNGLVYSTYLGGSVGVRNKGLPGDTATSIAVDQAGDAYVAGNTLSTDFPTFMPFQAVNKETALDTYTTFVAKLNPSGNALVYSTYLGGHAVGGIGDIVNAIAIDGADNAYVVGTTSSTNFPTVAAIQAANHALNLNNGGGANAFVAKFNATGSALVYSTYLGGSTYDSARAVAVDGSGNAYIAGFTESSDFPIINAWQAQNEAPGGGGGANAFVTKINVAGNALIYSTYLGGDDEDEANAIAVDEAGSVYVAGFTFSNNFPVADPVQSANHGASNGASNAFISVFDPTGSTLEFSTYLGGSGSLAAFQAGESLVYNGDSAAAIALDAMGNVYITGSTYSTDFPTAMAFQGTNKATVTGPISNAFVTKIAMVQPGGGGSGATGGGGAMGWGLISILGLAAALRSRKPESLAGTRLLRDSVALSCASSCQLQRTPPGWPGSPGVYSKHGHTCREVQGSTYSWCPVGCPQRCDWMC